MKWGCKKEGCSNAMTLKQDLLESEIQKIERPSWIEYFMGIASLISERSTCTRRKVGAVIVKDKHIISTGYNGVPMGIKHCEDIGCLRDKLNVPSGEKHELCRGLHAEQNAIIQAATLNSNIKDSDLFCTNSPCSICAKMLINAGINRIYYQDGYPDELGLEMLVEAGVTLIQVK